MKTKIESVVCYETKHGTKMHDVFYKSGKSLMFVNSVYCMLNTVLAFINEATEHGSVQEIEQYGKLKTKALEYTIKEGEAK